MLGSVDEHGFSIYSSEAGHFPTRRKDLDCVMIHCCHVGFCFHYWSVWFPSWILKSIAQAQMRRSALVFHEYHPVDIVHFSKKTQHYLLEFMINLMKMELYLRT